MNSFSSYQLKSLWSLTKNYRLNLLYYFLLEVLSLVSSLFFVYYSKRAVDIAMDIQIGNLRLTIACVVLSVVVGIVCTSIAVWINQRSQLSMTRDFQNILYIKQIFARWSVIKKWQTGDLVYRLNTDLAEVVQMMTATLLSFIINILKLLTSFAFLWIMDPILALMIVMVTPLFVFSKIYFKKVRLLNQKVRQAEGEFNNVLHENLRFRMLIRSLGLTDIRKEKLDKRQNERISYKMKLVNFNLFTQTTIKTVINAGYLIAFIWGVYRLNNNQITFGTMTAFIQLVSRIQTPILAIISFFPSFVRFRTSLDRIEEIENVQKIAILDQLKIERPEALILSDVGFKYEDINVVDNFSAEFKRGESVAILGASGKGKTTIIRLLLALIEPDQGKLEIEDQNGKIHLIGPEHISNFSYVPQGNTLFTGTIKENLQVSHLPVDDDKLKEVLALVSAEFVFDLPAGLDTKVGESGHGISEGQAQRISLARAVLQNNPIWLLDEPTSALDEETVKHLMNGLLKVGKDKIVIFVTHDHHVAKMCTRIIYMN